MSSESIFFDFYKKYDGGLEIHLSAIKWSLEFPIYPQHERTRRARFRRAWYKFQTCVSHSFFLCVCVLPPPPHHSLSSFLCACCVCTCMSTASSVHRQTDRLPHIRPEFTCCNTFTLFSNVRTVSTAPTSSRYFFFFLFLFCFWKTRRIESLLQLW